jgi:uncharacterized protein YbcC (UPF0753/DUF2309 family)
MNTHTTGFNEHALIHHLKHFLPAQAPLKDFVHHNTLHAFQDKKFFDALNEASQLFGYKVFLSLEDFRQMYRSGKISRGITERTITNRKGKENLTAWLDKLLTKDYDTSSSSRVGSLRARWKDDYKINLDKSVHSALFRILCSYLDQGISMWNFPVHHQGFLASMRELDKNSFSGFFKTERPKQLLRREDLTITELLHIVVGDEGYFEEYLFDQQFAHPGWSGIVSAIEDQPQTLLDSKSISLHDLILFELLLEIDNLDAKFGRNWAPLAHGLTQQPVKLFDTAKQSELFEVQALWQEAYEWTFYDQVLAGLKLQGKASPQVQDKSFQAMFCMDDRECSLRRYIENIDKRTETFGTPGFFGVEFFYQPADGKSYTKLCPAPVTPKFLIKEVSKGKKRETDVHFTKHSHSLLPGWIISQTLGFWSALRLFLNVFRPSMTPATSASFRHLDQDAQLTIENKDPQQTENGLQVGFTVTEMADRVEALLKSIGLVNDFAPIVYMTGHGATSVNNTHYAGYDCGACSGRPGSVNAKVISFMANHEGVRLQLKKRGVYIPEATQFVAALHDTTRDEITFFDENLLSAANAVAHKANKETFIKALDLNAKERSRRFDTIDTRDSLERIHHKIKRRSVSLFEPRPELNHATNALCVVGRRSLSKQLFLDRRSFMNSFDYKVDPEGNYLLGILKAVAPVAGGINLEYYFSRVDNHKLGAGTKLPHNVMGLIGVANGIDGDLRPGLPSQMIEVHDPVRLLIIVEHFPDIVKNAVSRLPETYEWYKNEWVRLVAVNPETRKLFVFEDEAFVPYEPLQDKIQKLDDIAALVESGMENLPVYLLN